MAEFIIFGTNNSSISFLIFAALFCVAFFILEAVSKQTAPLHRFGFGVICLFSAIALSFLPFIFSSVAAHDVDMAAIVWLVGAAIYIAIVAYGARRRSVDAYGHTKYAYLAVIPLAILILIFKKPKDRERIEQRTKTDLAMRIAAFAAFSVVALFVDSFVRDKLQQATQDIVVNTKNMPIGRAVWIQAALEDANAPNPINNETMFMGATANGTTLVIRFHLIGNMAQNMSEAGTKAIVQQKMCSDPMDRDLLDRGANIVFEYFISSEQSEPVLKHRIEIVAADCQ